MGAKLCRISFLSEHARRCEAVPAELQGEIRSMSDDSREVLQSLDEIVWAVNPQKDSLEHLVVLHRRSMPRNTFGGPASSANWRSPPNCPAQPLSSQSRHHLFLAVHEALDQHSQALGSYPGQNRHGLPRRTISKSWFRTTATGFDPVSSESNSPSSAAGFCNGLGNMRRRLAELGGHCLVESRLGHGTTIRFVLSFDGPGK